MENLRNAPTTQMCGHVPPLVPRGPSPHETSDVLCSVQRPVTMHGNGSQHGVPFARAETDLGRGLEALALALRFWP